MEEEWHWSYAPLAIPFLEIYLADLAEVGVEDALFVPGRKKLVDEELAETTEATEAKLKAAIAEEEATLGRELTDEEKAALEKKVKKSVKKVAGTKAEGVITELEDRTTDDRVSLLTEINPTLLPRSELVFQIEQRRAALSAQGVDLGDLDAARAAATDDEIGYAIDRLQALERELAVRPAEE
jgi:hypothetical protein